MRARSLPCPEILDFLKWPLVVLTASIGLRGRALPPRYDHVVVVIEENRTPTQIIGDRVNAPYINSLVDTGVRLGSMFAIEHPSQPNYLQLFSGSNQGVLDDNLPPNFSVTPTATYPFRTANLGAEILAAGFTFAGYSEQLETAGSADRADYDPHSATSPSVYYRRKHNPWANWVAKVTPPAANQITGTVNRAFTQFPSDFTLLPTVSFVVPNQLHDMHDGSRKQADDWLRSNLDAYAVWAETHNSLLILTWDEDDYNGINQIVTVLHGAGLRAGTVTAGTWTLHNLLRTLEDMYGTAGHAGSAAQVRPIIGPFATDPTVAVASFRHGLGGYTGVRDTQVWQDAPDTEYSLQHDLTADLDTNSTLAGNQVGQVLVRFENLFGSATNQIPSGALLHSAKLVLHTPPNTTGTDYGSPDSYRAHRMILDWQETSTWNSLAGGVALDDLDAAAAPSFTLVPSVDGSRVIFDVTADLERFQAGEANRGWVLRSSVSGTGNGWTLKSSEAATDPAQRPTLEVVYSPAPFVTWGAAHALNAGNNGPLDDADGDGAGNLAEFAYNLSPVAADALPLPPSGTAGLPAVEFLSDVAGGVLEVRFLRRIGATASGLSYTVEFADKATAPTWVPGQAPLVTPVDATWERVHVRDAFPGPTPSRFARVVVTLQRY